MITHWKGRALDTLTQAELIEVIQWHARRLASRTHPSVLRAQALGQVEMVKRGERVAP